MKIRLKKQCIANAKNQNRLNYGTELCLKAQFSNYILGNLGSKTRQNFENWVGVRRFEEIFANRQELARYM